MSYSDWSTTAGDNTTIGSVPLGENAMAPSDVNNAIRELIAQLADYRDHIASLIGTSTDYQPLDASLTALATLTTAADKGVYFTAADTPATFDLTSFGRTLASLADYAALRTALGSVTVADSSLGNPGFIKFSNNFMIRWGTGSIGANTDGSISYGSPSFSSFAVCIVSGGSTNTGIEGAARTTGTSGLSSQAISNGGNATVSYQYIVVGV